MADFDSPLPVIINNAIARSIFVSAWADGEEQAGRSRNLSGQNIDEIAPETPESAKLTAAFLTGKIEAANKLPFASIFAQACEADGIKHEDVCKASFNEEPDHPLIRYARDFGFSVGQMGLGSGVSWFDNHERFQLRDGINPPRDLVVPGIEYSLDYVPARPERKLAAPDKSFTPSR